jgi:glycosyltransferase involved in cell wall biosynthesis
MSSSSAVPLVSVIVPAYNSARTIERCMRALAAQATDHPFEVLVVHSGDDDTCERARRALAEVRTIQLPRRAMPPDARNAAAAVARGEILAGIDSDIYVEADWIDHVVRAAQSGYDLVCGSITNANPHSAVSRAEQLLMFNEFMPDQPQHPAWFALSGNTVMTRAAYDRFGPFDVVRAAEDVVFSRRVIAAGGSILFYPALRARHDNRTRLSSFLRNQVLVGRHTAIARRTVRFADSSSYALLLIALPFAPLIKLAKIAAHLGRYGLGAVRCMVPELPLLTVGVIAYSLGVARGALASAARVGASHSSATAGKVATRVAGLRE